MEPAVVIRALGALAQEYRLQVFRLLVQAGPQGLAAGALADQLGIPPSSLSFHLSQLSQAGLVRQQRAGRSILYSASYVTMSDLIAYLTENCCAVSSAGTDSCCTPPEVTGKVHP